MTGPVVIAAGGTGGHMVPAHVLALELAARGHRAVLFSDDRGLALPELFAGVERYRLASGSPSRGGPIGTAAAIARGFVSARRLLGRLGASVVVGFGGYPSLPGLLAALSMRLPTLIHEQNAVLGRVNRLLALGVTRIAVSYQPTARLRRAAVLTGNPVRAEVAVIGPARPADALGIVVLGGSQGASVLSGVVPRALAMLPPDRPMRVTQQARAAEIPTVRAIYTAAAIPAVLAPYFTDVPALLAGAELVIARAGASTIAELTAAGRAAILVPLPSAMDDHQTANARALADLGGAILIAQADFTPERLAAELSRLTPARLAAMAAAARAAGRPDAASKLADLVLEIAR